MISAFVEFEDGSVTIHKTAVKQVHTEFQPGFYEVKKDSQGNLIITVKKLKELHIPYTSDETDDILEIAKKFFDGKALKVTNELGFIHKIGILLYGVPGTGKTSLMSYIANYVVENFNGIVFFGNDGKTLSAAIALAETIRKTQPNPIVFIGDEFERYANNSESEMKQFLDGNESINNSMFLAATNYINQVPDSIKRRESRFKIVREITGITNKDVMVDITKEISHRIAPSLFTSDDAIKELYINTKSITLDEIKNLCLNQVYNLHIKPTNSKKTIGFELPKPDEKKDVIELQWNEVAIIDDDSIINISSAKKELNL